LWKRQHVFRGTWAAIVRKTNQALAVQWWTPYILREHASPQPCNIAHGESTVHPSKQQQKVKKETAKQTWIQKNQQSQYFLSKTIKFVSLDKTKLEREKTQITNNRNEQLYILQALKRDINNNSYIIWKVRWNGKFSRIFTKIQKMSQAQWLKPISLASWEMGDWEDHGSRPVHAKSSWDHISTNKSWVWWCMLVILAMQEV
jgi:hypothetical protein